MSADSTLPFTALVVRSPSKHILLSNQPNGRVGQIQIEYPIFEVIKVKVLPALNSLKLEGWKAELTLVLVTC